MAAEKKELSPWDEKVKIRLPKAPSGEDNHIIASVNGKVFKIKRGIEVEVPKPIAEVVENSFKAQEDAEAFIDAKLGNS